MTDLTEQNGALSWKHQINAALNDEETNIAEYGLCRLLGRGVISGFATIGSTIFAHSYIALHPARTGDNDWLEFGSLHPDFPKDKKRLGLLALQAQPYILSSSNIWPDTNKSFDVERRELIAKNLPLAVILLYGSVASRNPQDEFAALLFRLDIGPWQSMRSFEDPVLEQLRMMERAK